VPPYVGPSGWLGVNLDKGISWKRVAQLTREAYEKVVPPALSARIAKTIEIKPPKAKLKPEEFDPMQSARAQQVLKTLRKICLTLPETSEDKQFGSPVWRAGKKVFAQAYSYDRKTVRAAFWVGVDRQGLLTADPRYQIPPYMGHNGWIALDVTRRCDADEVRALVLDSYRHFALKRMLARLDG
jgi:predicted DNA-binding protein (MmcQ/YjbR family)